MIMNAIFLNNAPIYWGKGMSVGPVPAGTKQSINEWSNYVFQAPKPATQTKWLQQYRSHGIALLAGFKVGENHLIGIDIDTDRHVDPILKVIGNFVSGKKGAKGLTIFALAEPGVKRMAMPTRGKRIIDVLYNAVCLLPPTIHPDTKEPYEWVGTPLPECDLTSLPVVSVEKLKILEQIINNPDHEVLMSGESTHEAALKLTAQLADNQNDRLVCDMLISFLPMGYKGDTPKEIPGMLSDAKKKGFGQNQKAEYIYKAGEEGPIPYGYGEGGTYIFLHQKKKILVFATPSQLMSEPGLCDLAPMSFFKQWPRRNKEGHIVGIDAKGIGDMLMQACREAGPFHASRVRGAGIWHENGKVVENLRGPLPHSQDYTYVRFGQLPEFEQENEVDSSKVLDWLRLFPWGHHGYAELLLGWLATAAICGVFEWRPHVFISGPKHTGKTTLIDGITTLLEPLVINIDGSSTEAGIRQLIGPDSRPVVIDEFESDQNTHRMKSVVKLARSASSAKGSVARGTPEGKALQFNLSVTFLFAAINPVPGSNADQSRIVNLELEKHANEKSVKMLIDEGRAYFAERKTAWPHQMISLIEPILKGIQVFVSAMPPGEFRHAMNMAVLLSGAFVALNKRTPTLEEAQQRIDSLAGLLGSLAEAHDEDDSIDCLRHLLCAPTYSDGTIGDMLGEAVTLEKRKTIAIGHAPKLKDFGIVPQDKGFLVANKHPALAKLFANTIWADGIWKTPLRRLPGALTGNEFRVSMGGTATRCVFIPYDVLETIPGK